VELEKQSASTGFWNSFLPEAHQVVVLIPHHHLQANTQVESPMLFFVFSSQDLTDDSMFFAPSATPKKPPN
jgi:hypothetical protein